MNIDPTPKVRTNMQPESGLAEREKENFFKQKRLEIAMAALPAVITSADKHDGIWYEDAAEESVAFADALLKYLGYGKP